MPRRPGWQADGQKPPPPGCAQPHAALPAGMPRPRAGAPAWLLPGSAQGEGHSLRQVPPASPRRAAGISRGAGSGAGPGVATGLTWVQHPTLHLTAVPCSHRGEGPCPGPPLGGAGPGQGRLAQSLPLRATPLPASPAAAPGSQTGTQAQSSPVGGEGRQQVPLGAQQHRQGQGEGLRRCARERAAPRPETPRPVRGGRRRRELGEGRRRKPAPDPGHPWVVKYEFVSSPPAPELIGARGGNYTD